MNKWRVPSIEELLTLVDYSRGNPATPEDCPIKLNSDNYWSSANHNNHSKFTWYVYFGNGSIYYCGKNFGSYVRCVRGVHELNRFKGSRFVALANCIRDKKTGLLWQRNENAPTKPMTWQEAMDYVKSLNKVKR